MKKYHRKKSSSWLQGLEPTGLGAEELCAVASIGTWGSGTLCGQTWFSFRNNGKKRKAGNKLPLTKECFCDSHPDGGSGKGSGALPHCSPHRKREVTPEQKAGALRIHGALRGLQRPPPVLHPALAWLWAGGRGCCWRARYCHTSSFWTPRKPGTVKQRASKEQYATLPIV